MGKNKLRKFADMLSYPNVFQCSFADLQGTAGQVCNDHEMRGRWNELYFKNDHPVVLELGCGKGEYTIGLAKLFPERNFIGVDIKGARIWSGAKAALADGLTNVAFLRTNIELINRFFASGEVSEIWLTFPDPQMKKVNKRLTGTRFMQLYSEILTKDGQIHLKTDSQFLYAYTNAMIEVNGLPVLQKTDNVCALQGVLAIRTYYEQQWLDRGITIKYINFVNTPKKNYVEPDVEIAPDSYRSFNRSRRSQIGMQVVSVLMLLFAGFLFVKSSKAPKEEEEIEAAPENVATIPILATSVPLPAEVEFAGQTISLKRLDMRERYDREMNIMPYYHASTMLTIKRANRFFPVIEPILKANNIPDDFKYLCVIESNLDVRAISPARAAGLWQFMEGTARDFGLEIRDGVDERYHVEKSTVAACKFLRAAYVQYGNWMNVAASYNAGMGRISSELRQQAATSAFDLLLVPETSRYMFRILAAKEFMSHPKEYGYRLKKENLYPQVPVKYVEVTDIPDMTAFAKQHGISYATLKEFNAWLRDTKLTPTASRKTYQIAIPKNEDLQFDVEKLTVHNAEWVTD
ncbi:tRNA (guanine46-N7-)-methyltransferase [Candidatus Symbiothrix dinenymphae]|nr:tRNA (guanine46-N7-)-methyltransferase [Candidatus Symbiothrix dinenymphae]